MNDFEVQFCNAFSEFRTAPWCAKHSVGFIHRATSDSLTIIL